MAANGRLPQSQLSPIIGGTQLRNDAAAAWNAMARYIHSKTGTWIRTNGSDSAYRVLARQYYWRSYWCGRGACGNAAIPGTSNHGWGLAVDVPAYTRALIDRYGERFGWAKKWSDAAHESWHLKYRPGVWNGKDPGRGDPTLRKGSRGPSVIRLKKLLYAEGYRDFTSTPDGKKSSNRYNNYFGTYTKQTVQRFQRRNGLSPDGVVGQRTWDKLRK